MGNNCPVNCCQAEASRSQNEVAPGSDIPRRSLEHRLYDILIEKHENDQKLPRTPPDEKETNEKEVRKPSRVAKYSLLSPPKPIEAEIRLVDMEPKIDKISEQDSVDEDRRRQFELKDARNGGLGRFQESKRENNFVEHKDKLEIVKPQKAALVETFNETVNDGGPEYRIGASIGSKHQNFVKSKKGSNRVSNRLRESGGSREWSGSSSSKPVSKGIDFEHQSPRFRQSGISAKKVSIPDSSSYSESNPTTKHDNERGRQLGSSRFNKSSNTENEHFGNSRKNQRPINTKDESRGNREYQSKEKIKLSEDKRTLE